MSVEIVIQDSDPLISLGDVDHAVEGSIDVPSGRLVVMGCTEHFPDAPRLHVQPGTYRALAVMTGVGSIQNEWDPANDKYTVYLWPGSARQPKLLKHWKADA